ncbi:hypothetical protein MPSEU_000889000 [Mayamaea pseudoterrestris]|nr:hypothetical protein MPSEU_000889000 [Mayamaea pseudoterrestris]
MMDLVEKDQQLKVFVKDPTFSWLPATIIETDGADRVNVQIQLPLDWNKTTMATKKTAAVDKTEWWVDLNDYHNHQLPLQNSKSVRDIAELAHLHEAAILYQIKARHALQKPYTRVGEIIIAVNPCQWIDGLYSQDLQRLYAKHFVWQVPVGGDEETSSEEKKDENVMATSSTSFESFYDRLGHEPHIYEVSASAYRGLTLDGQDQTILVSGESGAGKTETVKLVLGHLSTIDMAALCADISPKNKFNEDMINYVVESSPVFEAFGNARTCSNHNSSRFGKVTRLHFGLGEVGMYSLAGSSFVTYLLETSRVAYHSPGERNFHIFYQLLAASNLFKAETLGEEWAGASVNDFRYLSGTSECGSPGATDAKMWDNTLNALEFFDWRGNALSMLLKSLGIILRLGNLGFGELSEGEARIETRDELQMLADIMGIPGDIIESAMTRRSLKTRQDELSVPLSCESAKEGCDALAKKIYCRIFASIVRKINEQTAPSNAIQCNGTISLVDIFGFERFSVNRFEQLCINYTNEKLQYKYVEDNLQRHRIEYEREGLELFDMKQFDNTDVLELFEGPKGIINSLSEESVRPNGNNASFVFKVKAAYKSHNRLIDEKLHMKIEFGISHYAGSVIYDASEFIERNSDKLPDSLLHLATKSSNALVALEFSELVRLQVQDDAADSTRKTKITTVMERFRSQLRDLVEEMSETHVRYIRCIKPCETMDPTAVDHGTVMRQLKCAGLVTAIEITRETFPNKLPFRAVEERFKCLLDQKKMKMMTTMEPEERCQFMMATLYAPAIKKFSTSNFTMPYACGKTKVFYRAGSLEILETARHEYLSARATLLQTWLRKVAELSRYRMARQGIINIQATWRTVRASLALMRLRAATIQLQTWLRCRLRRLHYRMMLEQGARLTSVCRQLLHCRRQYIMCIAIEQEKATVMHQSIKGIVALQAAFRSKRAQDCMMIQRGAALFIRNWYIHVKHTKTMCETKNTRHAFAETDSLRQASDAGAILSDIATKQAKAVQQSLSAPRGQVGKIRHRSATVIQAWVRRFRDFENYVRLLSSLACLQTRYRYIRARGKPLLMRGKGDIPKVVEVKTNSSVSTSFHDDLDRQPGGSPDTEERTRFVNKEHDVHEEQLMRELTDQKAKVLALEQEIAQMRDDAERHAQEIEADFDDRISGYEEEVLLLKQDAYRLEGEKEMHAKEMREADEAHKKSIQRLQYEIQKIQSSHRDYLDKIMALLDDTEAAQKLQTNRISEELEAIKRDRDMKVGSLKEEIKLLRGIGFGSKNLKQPMSESAQRLSRKLYAILAPDNLLLLAKEALQQQKGTPQLYIEENFSSKARNMISYLEEIVSVAEYEVSDARNKCSVVDSQVGALQQQLVCAYEELEYSRDGKQFR